MYIKVHILGGGSLLCRKKIRQYSSNSLFNISTKVQDFLVTSGFKSFFFDTEYSMKKRRTISSSRGRQQGKWCHEMCRECRVLQLVVESGHRRGFHALTHMKQWGVLASPRKTIKARMYVAPRPTTNVIKQQFATCRSRPHIHTMSQLKQF